MIESKHVIINHLNRWVESYDIVKEWDSDRKWLIIGANGPNHESSPGVTREK